MSLDHGALPVSSSELRDLLGNVLESFSSLIPALVQTLMCCDATLQLPCMGIISSCTDPANFVFTMTLKGVCTLIDKYVTKLTFILCCTINCASSYPCKDNVLQDRCACVTKILLKNKV